LPATLFGTIVADSEAPVTTFSCTFYPLFLAKPALHIPPRPLKASAAERLFNAVQLFTDIVEKDTPHRRRMDAMVNWWWWWRVHYPVSRALWWRWWWWWWKLHWSFLHIGANNIWVYFRGKRIFTKKKRFAMRRHSQ